jgi:hypothetical protein
MVDDPLLPPASFRPRFGLRLLFLAMTALAVYLGYRAALRRAIAEMVAQQEAVIQKLSHNFSSVPTGTTQLLPPRLSSQDVPFHRGGGISQGRLTELIIDERLLENSSGSPLNSRGLNVRAVREHYERELASTGLKRISTSDDIEAAASVWTMDGMDAVVLFDVHSENEGQHIRVELRFIASQQAAIW